MLYCCLCNREFNEAEELMTHLVFNHHIVVNNCSLRCGQPGGCANQTFSRLYALKAHLKKHHAFHNLNRVNPIEVVVDDQNLFFENDANIENGYFQNNIEDNNFQNNVQNDNVPNNVPDDDVGEIDALTLENFIETLYSNVESYVVQLYSIPSVSRKLVDTIVLLTSELISNSVTVLRESIMNILSKFDVLYENYAEDVGKLQNMLSVLSDPFEYMSSEQKRFCALADKGVYVEPVAFEMGHVDKYVPVNGTVQLVRAPVYGYVIPLRLVFKQFLEIPGVFDEILTFMNANQNNIDGKVTNFLQGNVWREMMGLHGDKCVLPLAVDFDDYEPNNSIGSHAGAQSLGAMYARLLCLPPESASQLDNIFLFNITVSKYHKHFGNAVTFASCIDELKFLLEEGITIVVEDRNIQVYFCLCAVLGDNLGCNVILGFMRGFNARFYCRFCKLHRDTASRWCRRVPVQSLRTIANYENDVNLHEPIETGIFELCVFNDLPGFHCLSMSTCDIMHDVYHGTTKYGISSVLSNLIQRKGYFSIEVLIDRIKGFDLGPNEIGNRPPTHKMKLASLTDCSMNLSASEWLCLARYLGLMIGDLVPETCRVWRLYLIINEIVQICSSPSYEEGVDDYLSRLVQEHHELYVHFFGNLKPKHHFMLHYSDHMKNFGPLSAVSSFLAERNHKRGKIYAHSCNSRINFALTTAIKYQLYLAERLCRPDGRQNIVSTKVSKVNRASLTYQELPFNDEFVDTVQRVEVSGTAYTVDAVVVVRVGGMWPTFGKVLHIILKDNIVLFVLQILNVIRYREHICAYEVEDAAAWCCLRQNELLYHYPLHQRFTSDDGKKVIVLRHML